MSKAVISLQRQIGVEPDGNFGPATAKAFARFFKLSVVEAAHILGQCHHESMGFKVMEENLNYSAKRLRQIFPKYFDEIQAKYAAHQPMAIANKVYANRMGNGPELSGDGWRHRGLGPLQLTGKDNQTRFLQSVNRPIQDAELIKDELAFESAVWFFRDNKILPHCRNVSQIAILAVSRAVNIGNPMSQVIPHGLDDRAKWTLHYFKLLSS